MTNLTPYEPNWNMPGPFRPGGVEMRTKAFDRFFFGFQPSSVERETTIVAGDRLRRKQRISTPLRAKLFHTTLLIVSETEIVSDDEVDRYRAVGDRVAAQSFAPFRLVFDRASRLEGDRRPLVLTAREGRWAFRSLQRAVIEALAALGLPKSPHTPPQPHVTLLYGCGSFDEAIEPISWEVRELVLIQSLVNLSEHKVLKRWLLIPAPDLFRRL